MTGLFILPRSERILDRHLQADFNELPRRNLELGSYMRRNSHHEREQAVTPGHHSAFFKTGDDGSLADIVSHVVESDGQRLALDADCQFGRHVEALHESVMQIDFVDVLAPAYEFDTLIERYTRDAIDRDVDDHDGRRNILLCVISCINAYGTSSARAEKIMPAHVLPLADRRPGISPVVR